jgi:hypothetical protein
MSILRRALVDFESVDSQIPKACRTNLVAFTLLIFLCQFTACSRAQELSATKGDSSAQPAMMSAHRLLGPSDYPKFQVGRLKDDILKGIQWRGNFEMSCSHRGSSIAAISFALFTDNPDGDDGEIVWAIFRDDKFEKFVRWPVWETKDVPYEGTTRSVYVPIKLGDFHRLLAAAESKAVSIEQLKSEMTAKGETPNQIDPGLTVAYLAAQALTGGQIGASKDDLMKNAMLRDQFNAARWKIGMMKDDVEKIFNATPLQSVETSHGNFAIYGSFTQFDILRAPHYSNVLVLYENGRVLGIYSGESVPGGDESETELRELFPELNSHSRD